MIQNHSVLMRTQTSHEKKSELYYMYTYHKYSREMSYSTEDYFCLVLNTLNNRVIIII